MTEIKLLAGTDHACDAEHTHAHLLKTICPLDIKTNETKTKVTDFRLLHMGEKKKIVVAFGTYRVKQTKTRHPQGEKRNNKKNTPGNPVPSHRRPCRLLVFHVPCTQDKIAFQKAAGRERRGWLELRHNQVRRLVERDMLGLLRGGACRCRPYAPYVRTSSRKVWCRASEAGYRHRDFIERVGCIFFVELCAVA